MAYVQKTGIQIINTAPAPTPAITTTPGNALVAFIGCSPGAGADVTGLIDTYGNTWDAVSSNPVSVGPEATSNCVMRAWIATNIAGGSGHTFTVQSVGGGGGYFDVSIFESSGRDTSNAYDNDGGNAEGGGGGATSHAGVTFTVAAGADVFMGDINNSGTNPQTWTPGSGFTIGFQCPDGSSGTAGCSQYQSGVTGGSIGTPFTTGDNVQGSQIAVSLKPAGGGGATGQQYAGDDAECFFADDDCYEELWIAEVTNSAPVPRPPQSFPQNEEQHFWWEDEHEEPIAETFGWFGPVGANAPPAISPIPEDGWYWGADDDQVTFALVESYQQSDNPATVVPMVPPEDAWNWSIDDDQITFALVESYQQSDNRAPNPVSPTDDPWDWTEEYEDELVILDDVNLEIPPQLDDGWYWNESEDVGTWLLVDSYQQSDNAQAPNVGQLCDDAWDWAQPDDHSDEPFGDDSAPVGRNQPQLPAQDPDGADLDDVGDDWEHFATCDSAPVSANFIPPASAPAEDAWDWSPEDHTDDLQDDDGSNVKNPNQPAQPVEDAPGADHDDAGDDWENTVTDSAPVGASGQAIAASQLFEDSWDWSEACDLVDDLQDDDGFNVRNPNAIANPLLAPQDDWDWSEEHSDEPDSADSAPVGATATATAVSAPIFDDAWDWTPDETSDDDPVDDDDGYSLANQPPIARDDPWQQDDDETDELLGDDSSPVRANFIVPPSQFLDDSWDWWIQDDEGDSGEPPAEPIVGDNAIIIIGDAFMVEGRPSFQVRARDPAFCVEPRSPFKVRRP